MYEYKPETPLNGRFSSNDDLTIQRRIGKRLREIYGPAVREPVPDRFVELLGRLDEEEWHGKE